jgi:hypothetical protein
MNKTDQDAIVAIRDAYRQGASEVDFPALRDQLGLDSYEVACGP